MGGGVVESFGYEVWARLADGILHGMPSARNRHGMRGSTLEAPFGLSMDEEPDLVGAFFLYAVDSGAD